MQTALDGNPNEDDLLPRVRPLEPSHIMVLTKAAYNGLFTSVNKSTGI